jgi:hypothetical protein
MQKALTKEDLIYILDSIFKISNDEENAFEMKEDGLYVKSWDNHEQNTNLHIEERLRLILDKITVDNAGNIYYDTHLLSRVSQEPKNAIQQKADGIYVEDIIQDTKDHMTNQEVHVTKEKQEEWDETLKNSKKYTIEQINEAIQKLTFHDFIAVERLPEENISSNTCYIWVNDPNKPDDIIGMPYIWFGDNWHILSITRETLESLATKKQLEEEYLPKQDYQKYDNMPVLSKFSETEDGTLQYQGNDIRQIFVSEEYGNAVELRNGKLYVKDYTSIIHELQIGSAFTSEILYNKECTDSGLYELEYSIDDFSMLLIDYYYKPHDESQEPGCAKSVMVNVTTLNELYDKGIDYILELGYGINVANSKIRMTEDKLYVNYYHNICIYKITGIRKSGGDE